MKPREFALRNGMTSDYQAEAFNLDIVKLKDACLTEECLSTEFEENFKYRLRAFIFFPLDLVGSDIFVICIFI